MDGIKLYRGLAPLNDSSTDFVVQRNKEDLSKTIKLLLSEITGTIIDVDLKRDNIAMRGCEVPDGCMKKSIELQTVMKSMCSLPKKPANC